MCNAIAVETPPPPHDPRERVVVARARRWDVRQFPTDDAKFRYFASRGYLHLQLWDATCSVSILTPSRLTDGNFEIWTASAGFIVAPAWRDVVSVLPHHDLPGPARLRALDRWLIAPHEPPQVRLLRSWWSGKRGQSFSAR